MPITEQERNDVAEATILGVSVAFLLALVFIPLAAILVTLGWNFGVTEAFQGYLGADYNITLIEGFFVALFARGLK